jgi:hypothetical protein
MIKVQKQPQDSSATIIRAASSSELADYEKKKLVGIEEFAQQNKIETIRVNGRRVEVDKDTKTANINVGSMAFKSAVTSNDIDNNELFFIRCSLD